MSAKSKAKKVALAYKKVAREKTQSELQLTAREREERSKYSYQKLHLVSNRPDGTRVFRSSEDTTGNTLPRANKAPEVSPETAIFLATDPFAFLDDVLADAEREAQLTAERNARKVAREKAIADIKQDKPEAYKYFAMVEVRSCTCGHIAALFNGFGRYVANPDVKNGKEMMPVSYKPEKFVVQESRNRVQACAKCLDLAYLATA